MDFMDKHQIFFDAEFTGLRQDTELMSIGLCTGDGVTFYAEFNDYDKSKVSDWLKENVEDHMIFRDKDAYHHSEVRSDLSYNIWVKDSKEKVRAWLWNWLQNESIQNHHKQIQMFTDCYAYDWVLFNNLICPSDALELPEFIYYIPFDLSTALQMNNIDPDITREDFISDMMDELAELIKEDDGISKHNPLWDALVASFCFRKLDLVN